MSIVDVQAPVAVDVAFSYRVPPNLSLQAGDFVTMPLGQRTATGVVWHIREGDGGNLKTILSKAPCPPLAQPLRDFIDWVARWTLTPRGSVLRMAMFLSENAVVQRVGVTKTGKEPEKITPARERVLLALGTPLSKAQLTSKAEVSTSVIEGLLREGVLTTILLAPEPIAPPPNPNHAQHPLEPEQEAAAQTLITAVQARCFVPFLLEGVTGSGKTEVYFEAIAAALREGRQALVLMPEIALTAQCLDRFAARFGVRPVEWHSDVSLRRRERIWEGVAKREVSVVVGARSALFLPFADLGLIIIDEEHEGAYKQEEGVVYHARDMGVVRARLEAVPIVLASATPSVETRVNAIQGRYQWLRLRTRYRARALPEISPIDQRRTPPKRGTFLSPPLVEAVAETLAAGEQALLFLNRRGYAPLTVCRTCGHRFACPDCTSWLVEHRFRKTLMCHLCGRCEPVPDSCPECHAVDTLTAFGPGVERIAEEAQALFPQARTLILSSDTAKGIARLREDLTAIAQQQYDLIIGTQLIAKGHDFPALTLVGVVDADIGLANGDPRAAEHTFQLLTQATGRAGRGEKPGRALLQSYQPDHPILAALCAGDIETFYETEINQRRRGGLPPFGRLAALIISSTEADEARHYAQTLARAALPLSDRFPIGMPGTMKLDKIILLGPAEAPIPRLRNRYRFRITVKAPRSIDLQGFLRTWLETAPPPRGGVRVNIDIDPQSFL